MNLHDPLTCDLTYIDHTTGYAYLPDHTKYVAITGCRPTDRRVTARITGIGPLLIHATKTTSPPQDDDYEDDE